MKGCGFVDNLAYFSINYRFIYFICSTTHQEKEKKKKKKKKNGEKSFFFSFSDFFIDSSLDLQHLKQRNHGNH